MVWRGKGLTIILSQIGESRCGRCGQNIYHTKRKRSISLGLKNGKRREGGREKWRRRQKRAVNLDQDGVKLMGP